jgi:hypothetical protein
MTAPRPRRKQRNQAIVVSSILGFAVAAAVVFLVVRYASSRPDEVNLGDRVFEVGRADRLARRITEQREPFLFKDPLNRERELYVQHLGRDSKKGWLAFEAYAPEAPRELRCLLDWQPNERRFRNPCGQPTSFPEDGAGLVSYEAKVNDSNIVVVDLRTRTEGPARPS